VIFFLSPFTRPIRSHFGETPAVWTLAVATAAGDVAARARRCADARSLAQIAEIRAARLGDLCRQHLALGGVDGQNVKFGLTGNLLQAAGARGAAVVFAFTAGATFCFLLSVPPLANSQKFDANIGAGDRSPAAPARARVNDCERTVGSARRRFRRQTRESR